MFHKMHSHMLEACKTCCALLICNPQMHFTASCWEQPCTPDIGSVGFGLGIIG